MDAHPTAALTRFRWSPWLPDRETLRWLGLAFAWVAVWAVYDIAVVEGTLRPTDDTFPQIGAYHAATFLFLVPLTTLAVFRRRALTPLLLFLGGWEDLLYFWFQGRSVPASLPWIPGNPSDLALFARALLALAVAVWLLPPALRWAESRWRRGVPA